MKWTIETGLVSREATDWIDARYRGYQSGEVSEVAICGEMVQIYQGLREDELRRAAREFFATRRSNGISFPRCWSWWRNFAAMGADIWAVSSTNDWVIEEGVRRFGIPAERVLAARVEVKKRHGLRTLCLMCRRMRARSLRWSGRASPRRMRSLATPSTMRRCSRSRRGPFLSIRRRACWSAAPQEGWPVYYPASVAAS